ncbi:hypothetical protein C5E44_14855 [Nocardia nova]|uniref:hypothetical protein n=1 Tax=Nocardia nova TaxID=37330 RepID=UPI000CEA65E1|nr:hypothetical protein C5E44_14855 [Nocardia nova]
MFPSEGEPQPGPGPLFDGAADAEAGPQPDPRAVVRERSHAAIPYLRGEADTAALAVWREALGPVGPVGPPRPASGTPSVSSRGRSRPALRTACPKAE